MSFGIGVIGAAAFTVPSASAAPQPTIDQVRNQVNSLERQAEQASEAYNETKEQLASLNVRVVAAKNQLAAQQRQVAVAKQQLGLLAAETYRQGELSTLDLVLSNDPQSLLAQAGLLPTLDERQSGALTRLRKAESEMAKDEADLLAQQHRIETANINLKLQQNAVNQKLAQAQAELAGLQAAERAAVLRAQAADRFVPAAAATGPGGIANCDNLAIRAPTARVKVVLQFACSHLGDPYVWAAAGPGTWDCSGLTMAAWARAGVSLPHSSRLQATYGARVPLNSLQAGDLLFFYQPISHVAIYLGNGLMLHAPHSGDVVRIASVYTTPTAAVRL